MSYVAIGARCLIGMIFLASAVSKVTRRNSFRDFTVSVRRMRLLSPKLARPVASAVVIFEFLTSALLAVPTQSTGVAGFALAMGLLLTFGVAIIVAVRKGVRAPCSCFGTSPTPLGIRHAVRNIVLVAVVVVGVMAELLAGPAVVGGLIIAALSGLVLGGLVAVFDDIVDLFQPESITTGAFGE